MLRRTAKIIVATTAAGVLGAGVAVAADPPTCLYGNTPKAAQSATAPRTTAQQRLRERDGTGPRHAERVQQRRADGAGARNRGRMGPRDGSGNPSCPYRS